MPNYYSGWFLNRLKEGYFDVRNPMNPHQISRIETSPDLVDCIVFWTKNPLNLMGRLNAYVLFPVYANGVFRRG